MFEREVVDGMLLVETLVQAEWGVVWFPKVSVMVDFDGEKWCVNVDDGLADGYLGPNSIEWWGGCYDSHVGAVCEFLEGEVRPLWALLKDATQTHD